MAIIKPEFVINVDYYKGFAVNVYNGKVYLAEVHKGPHDVFYTEPIKRMEWKDGRLELVDDVKSMSFLVAHNVPEAIGNMAKAHNILKRLNK